MNADDIFAPLLFEFQQNAHHHHHHHHLHPHTTHTSDGPVTLDHDEDDHAVAAVNPEPASSDTFIDLTGEDSDSNTTVERGISHADESIFLVKPPERKSKKRKRTLLKDILELLDEEEPGSETLKELRKRALQCPVCFDTIKTPTSTLCGHVFCAKCIQGWVQKNKRCPTCNKPMQMKHMHPIYL